MSDFDKQLDDFLFFDGAFPNFTEGIKEVPLPEGYYYCMECGNVTNYYKDFCSKCESKGNM